MKNILFILVFISTFSYSQKIKNNFQIGDSIPNFSSTLTDGTKFNLESLRGSLILIDFTASWCLPCRKQNAELNKTYQTFVYKRFINAKHFNIISISLDDNQDLWKVTANKDNILWKQQICDGNGWYSPLAKLFEIKMLPTNYLVDGNGKIIAKNIWFDELNNKLRDQLPNSK